MEQLAQQASALLGTSAGILLLVIGAIAGLIFGLLIAAFGWKRKETGNAATVNDLQNDFDDYKGQVNEHFAKTSELVGKLTNDYQEVYRHLATGSAALCTVSDTDSRIGFDDSIQLSDNSVKAKEEPKPETPAENTKKASDKQTSEDSAAQPAKEKSPDAAEAAEPVKSKVNPPVAASIPESITPKS